MSGKVQQKILGQFPTSLQLAHLPTREEVEAAVGELPPLSAAPAPVPEPTPPESSAEQRYRAALERVAGARRALERFNAEHFQYCDGALVIVSSRPRDELDRAAYELAVELDRALSEFHSALSAVSKLRKKAAPAR